MSKVPYLLALHLHGYLRTVILAKIYQSFFHHTDQLSNAIMVFKTDLDSFLCLLKIGQSALFPISSFQQ